MTLKSQLAEDAKNAFLNSDEFAENITYTPRDAAARAVKAVVVRSPAEADPESNVRVLRNQCEVYVANDSSEGVTSVTEGYDKVSFAEHVGGSVRDWAVVRVIDNDSGMWHLLVQK